MPWSESSSAHFEARHEASDERGAAGVLELLESTRRVARPRLSADPRGGRRRDARRDALRSRSRRRCCRSPGPRATRPRGATSPAGARAARCTCSPRAALERRASAVPDSRDMLMLTPAALYAQLVVATNNRRLPPPLRPRTCAGRGSCGARPRTSRARRCSRVRRSRGACARTRAPRFPPTLRDAALLGGTIFDLLERERGAAAAVSLAFTRPEGSPARALEHAFSGGS